jgi:hypothetical protein
MTDSSKTTAENTSQKPVFKIMKNLQKIQIPANPQNPVKNNSTTRGTKDRFFEYQLGNIKESKSGEKTIPETKENQLFKVERNSNHSHEYCHNWYPCDYTECGKVYKSRENLKIHVKNKHLNQKPYKCSYCNLRFSYRNGKNNFI